MASPAAATPGVQRLRRRCGRLRRRHRDGYGGTRRLRRHRSRLRRPSTATQGRGRLRRRGDSSADAASATADRGQLRPGRRRFVSDASIYDWSENGYGRPRRLPQYRRMTSPGLGMSSRARRLPGPGLATLQPSPGLPIPCWRPPTSGVDPYRWQADQDLRREAGRRGLIVGAVTGVLAAAVAIGVSTLGRGVRPARGLADGRPGQHVHRPNAGGTEECHGAAFRHERPDRAAARHVRRHRRPRGGDRRAGPARRRARRGRPCGVQPARRLRDDHQAGRPRERCRPRRSSAASPASRRCCGCCRRLPRPGPQRAAPMRNTRGNSRRRA